MSEPVYIPYATHPTASGPKTLRAKLFRPPSETPEERLFVWVHGGDFRAGSIEDAAHDRMARTFLQFGYAVAVVEYRLDTDAAHLQPATQAALPRLAADAARMSKDVPEAFAGAAALAAMEDLAAFLTWHAHEGATHSLPKHVLLGGAEAGAITVLNTLHIAPQIGLDVPPVTKAIAITGAFPYPSHFKASETPVLAVHGPDEQKLKPTSIRSYAYLAGKACTYLEAEDHKSGDLRFVKGEALRRAVRRLTLFDRGTEIFLGRPGEQTQAAPRHHAICMFTCVRNEGPFLLEWIAHNRAIGVTHFLIFSNECDDGTTEILDALQARGIVTHVPNPSTALNSKQHLNITIACARFARVVRKADYVILSDIDEFIQIDTCDGTLNGAIAAMGNPDVISMSELLYGFGGVETFENKLVTSQFRQSEPVAQPDDAPVRRGVKSIMRVKTCIDGLANHRPRLPADKALAARWVDGSGAPVADGFRTDKDRGLDARGRYDLIRVNHYTLRSAESLLVKFERGDAVRGARMNPTYFTKRNGQGYSNDGFLPAIPALKRELARLLSDPEILQLHRKAVARHQVKIADLKTNPEFQEVWAGILDEVHKTPDDVQTAAEQTAAE
ncbi:MAG: glycosyltransferase family 2 protein [Pseudomonadota bacterium]